MIDNVRVTIPIRAENIKLPEWEIKTDKDGVVLYYYRFLRRLWIAYYPDTENLLISGSLLGIKDYDRASNVDDVFLNIYEIQDYFTYLNEKINNFLTGVNINILYCKVTRCDFCFNVKTPYYERYIEFFNLCYKYCKKFKDYKNFTIEKGCGESESFYLKTEKQYEKNSNQNFTLNFYNKKDQLVSKRAYQENTFGHSAISEHDIECSDNILRLELQAHYNCLVRICRENNIPIGQRRLIDFIDINVCRNAICRKIKYFFTECDFYSYKEALKMIENSNVKLTPKFRKYLLDISRRYKVNNVGYNKKLIKLGIYPYMFIPQKWNIPKLQNPIKLIDEKIDNNKLHFIKLKGENNEKIVNN